MQAHTPEACGSLHTHTHTHTNTHTHTHAHTHTRAHTHTHTHAYTHAYTPSQKYFQSPSSRYTHLHPDETSDDDTTGNARTKGKGKVRAGLYYMHEFVYVLGT